MLNKETIVKQLERMGAPKDKAVIVHISLRAVGEIDAQYLLDIFIEYFTSEGGVLIVPTHTWHNTSKDIVLDMAIKDTCVGTFSKIALQDKRGKRTSNPTHSVILFGNEQKIQEFLDLEEIVSKPTDKSGVYSKIDYILLVGVTQNKNTYIHCVEEILGINRFNSEPTKMKIKRENGKIEEKLFYEFDEKDLGDVSTRFYKYEPAFRYHGGIVDGFIGNAKTEFCDAKILLNVMKLIRKNSKNVELLSGDSPIEEKFFKN